MSKIVRTCLALSLLLAIAPQSHAIIQQGPSPCVDNPDTPQNECPILTTVEVVGSGVDIDWVGASFYEIPSMSVGGVELWDPVYGDLVKNDTASGTKELGDCNEKSIYEKANPINISTGAKIERELDIVGAGLGSLLLSRTYNSRNTGDGIFGRYWSSNFDYRLTATTGSVTLIDPRHGQHTFNLDATSGKYLSTERGVWAEVVKNADGTYTATWLNDSTQNYSATGKITSVTDQSGVGFTFTYNGSGKLDRVTSSTGRYVQFEWTGTQLTKITAPNGGQYLYTYYANRFGTGIHLLSTVTVPGTPGATVTYHYEQPSFSGALTGKSIAGVRFSTFAYDGQGRAIRSEHAGVVQRSTFVYNTLPNGMLQVTETNPYGKQAVHRFENGNLVDVTGLPSTNCPASLATATRDANGFPNLETAYNGRVTDFDYDAGGYLTREVRGHGTQQAMTIESEWEPSTGRLLKRTVVGDSSTEYQYWPDGRKKSEITRNLAATGVLNQIHQTSYTYTNHPNGVMASMTIDGPLPNDTLVYSFSSAGDLLVVTDPLGTAATFSGYNGLGLPGQVVDRYGVTISYAYDARGRVLSTSRTFGSTTTTATTTYDARGRVISSVLPSGIVKNYTYDDANRLLSVTEPEEITDPDPEYLTESLEKKWTFTYSANSDVTQARVNRKYSFSFFDEELHKVVHGGSTTGEVVSFIDYDELGRVKARRGNHGQNFRYSYDESGNVTSMMDSLGRTTTFVYDGLNRVSSSTDPNSGTTEFTYDAGGRLASARDARGLLTSYSYDGFGQMWRQESPDTGITTHSYDSLGRRTGTTRPDLTVATFTYDGLGRVASAQIGSALQIYTYDSCTLGLGRLCSVADASGSTAFSYTPLGSIAQQINTIAGTAYTTSFSYDNLDRPASITYPDGKVATYTHVGAELRGITANPNGSSAVSVVDGMRYQPFGELTSLQYGNGLFRTINFDNDARLTSIVTSNPAGGTTLQSLSFAWDANNSITGIVNSRGTALTQSLTYDELGRLTGASRADGTAESFGYDSLGNRTSHTKGAVVTSLTYATSSNRLLESSSSSLLRLWTYDANGNSNGYTGADGVAVGLHYDAFGRVDSSSRNGQSTVYLVNALGQRVSKAGPAGTWRYIYSPDGALLAELKVGTGWTDYIRANGEVVGLIRGNSLRFVHSDQVSRPELVTSSTKAIVWAASNFAFDRQVTTDTIGGLNLGLPGQYFDGETGNWYNYFRDGYDGSVGRYIQSDPIGLMGGANTYLYALGNGVQYMDPFGLETLLCARELGNKDKPAVSPGSSTAVHEYLVIGGQAYSFTAGGSNALGMLASQGKLTQDERTTGEKCKTISTDPEYDKAAKAAVDQVGVPKYNVGSFPFTPGHAAGFRNCQTWAADVLSRAGEIYQENRKQKAARK